MFKYRVMRGLSIHMIEALQLAKKHEDGCINKYQAHPSTIHALVRRGLLRPTSGYGYKHGAVYQLTEEGKKWA